MMHSTSHLHCLARCAAASLILLAGCGMRVALADSYDPSSQQLTIPSIAISTVTYSDLTVTVGHVVSGPAGTAPNASQDTYSPLTNQLSLTSVSVGSRIYYNVVITVRSLVSVGGVTGADSFAGTTLSMPFVQAGDTVYKNVDATVGELVGVAGGMPAQLVDSFDPVTDRLTIPVVEAHGRVYTNVTVRPGQVLSLGGPHSSIAAAALAVKLGKPSRFLVGLGVQGDLSVPQTVRAQAVNPDIYDQYLVGAGPGDWTTWNSPPGAYVGIVAADAQAMGAVPMYTLYQMAQNGDGNLAGLKSATFMATYWSNVRLMFTQIAAFNRPSLVNFEPDFWGYTEQHAVQGDPSTVFAYVNTNADCATLSNDARGVAACLIQMARQYAPKAYVGFPYSTWGANTTAAVVEYMSRLGANNADFIVAQTLDRDAGCIEAQDAADSCARAGSGWYWDPSNLNHPNFEDHLAVVEAMHTGLGNLPVIWWQTPMGVPSSVAGGADFHFRDNREQYFLTHPTQLTAVGGLGVVFSTGENHQTNMTTDGGQFLTLSRAYFGAPTLLP